MKKQITLNDKVTVELTLMDWCLLKTAYHAKDYDGMAKLITKIEDQLLALDL